MNRIKILLVAAAALVIGPALAFAGIPWSSNISTVTGATPAPTTFSSNPVVIDTLSTTQTSLTLVGGTAGGLYTLVIMQDGTGSRSFTNPVNVTAAATLNGGVIPTPPSAANAYTVWVLQGVGATPTYSLLAVYDNMPLNDVYTSTVATAGTAVALNAVQSVGSVIIPGVTVANVPICQAQTLPATWQTGDFLAGFCGTNFCQCDIVNPTAATNTPATVTLNVRVTKP